jgi:hypothetical protein
MNLRGLRNGRAKAADSTSRRGASTTEKPGKGQRIKEAGQIIAIFALMLTALIGLVGIAIDVTFAWREELRVQRAADAAALAGVVYLPGNVSGGQTSATAEATKNGYSSGSGTSVTALQDPDNVRQMDVTITSQVPTFFVRVFGINSFTVTRAAKAVFILPVPMGSPDQYYGAFGTYNIKNDSGTVVPTPITGPSGEPMSARGFWASVVTQGAGTANGDAYEPKRLNGNQTGSNPQRNTANYYDYAVFMPAGTTGGHVYIFDPVYCATDGKLGTGEFWLGGNDPVSTYFKLYNTNNQPYNPSAHTLLGTSGNLFANMQYHDSNAGSGSGGAECKAGTTTDPNDPRSYHMKWWDMTAYIGTTLSGGASGQTYRIRTTSDPGDSSQDNANANNNFAIYASASGGTPQVYGIGAMQMQTPLPGGLSSVFYLAQIDAQSGAGKTIEIKLWDPGDTSTTARLSILQPTAAGWQAVPSLTWTANAVTGDASPCTGGSGSYIETSTGGSSHFNGCWLTIDIVVPTTYSAPQNGWWKIQYDMIGSGASTDETTWQVNIRGNPVHLIPG